MRGEIAESTPPAAPEPVLVTPERRQVTALYCAYDGATASGQPDPETFCEILSQVQEVCEKVVARFEGHIVRTPVDDLLAYFGYPEAHEDDAQRAVRTGLGIVDAVGRVGKRLRAERGMAFRVRVGIHTGLGVVQPGGEDSAQAHYTGEAPNAAARLSTTAWPSWQ